MVRSPSRTSGPVRSSLAALAADLASALDPVAFAQSLHIHPDPWQVEVLRSVSQRILLNCSRQSGKSTVAALLSLHEAIYRPRSLTLLLSPAQRQSQELFRKVLAGYKFLGRPVAAEAENQMSLALENGSRVVSLPGNESTIRGFSGSSLLIVDEASRVSDDLYASVAPMLAVSQGRLIALSTPNGISGWWSSAWHERASSWSRWEVPAEMCPRIPADFLVEQRLELGEWKFEQEYNCKFLDDEWVIFSQEAIDSIANQSIAEVDL